MTPITKKIIYAVILLTFVIIVFQQCGRDGCNPFEPKIGKSDTVTIKTTDTVLVVGPTVRIPVYVPVQTGTIAPTEYPKADSNYEILADQYVTLADKHFSTNIYSDSIPLKDSAGADRGYVYLTDAITQNKVKSRDAKYQLKYPVVTNTTTTTITNTLAAKAKNQLYAGIGLTGNLKSPIDGGGIHVTLKTKNDQLVGIFAGMQKTPAMGALIFQPQFGVNTQWKIKLRK